MSLCNLILPQFKRDGEVDFSVGAPGQQAVWSPTPRMKKEEPTVPKPLSTLPVDSPVQEEPRIWTRELTAASILDPGGSVVFDVPEGFGISRYVNNLRSTLFSRKETRDSKWSLTRAGAGVKVTRMIPSGNASVTTLLGFDPQRANPPEPVVPEVRIEQDDAPTVKVSIEAMHIRAVYADIDDRIAELVALRQGLQKLYGEDQICQSS